MKTCEYTSGKVLGHLVLLPLYRRGSEEPDMRTDFPKVIVKINPKLVLGIKSQFLVFAPHLFLQIKDKECTVKFILTIFNMHSKATSKKCIYNTRAYANECF